MPATYAHLAFGQQMLPVLPGRVREAADRCRDLYLAGLHGPDPLFYYNPFRRNAMDSLASRLHQIPGRELFATACQAVAQEPSDGSTAYLYGLLTHYCLDSLCHPWVNSLADAGVCGHSELETEFDRLLLERSGVTRPHFRDLGAHLHLTESECAQAALCLPPVTGRQMQRSIRNMSLFTRVLAGRTLISREMLEFSLPMLGGSIRQHLMPRKADPRLKPLTDRLLVLYREAEEKFPRLAGKLEVHMRENVPLDEDFNPIMG